MTETTTTKQRLLEWFESPLDRSRYGELVDSIYESFAAARAAEKLLEDLLAKAGKSSEQESRDLRERAGVLAFALGRYRVAVEQLEHVKARKEGGFFLGRALAELGRTDKALDFLRASSRGDDDFETAIFIVDALCQERRPEEARKICDRFAKSHGQKADWLYAAGRVLETEGVYDEAMSHYEKALLVQPDHRLSLFRLALNADLNGEDERAMDLYAKCAMVKPACVGALVNLGILYEDAGRYEDAIKCYKHVLDLDPAHGRARLYLKDAEASLNMIVPEERKQIGSTREDVLRLPLSNFELSARSRAALEKLEVKTLGELAEVSEETLIKSPNFGETSLEEIKSLLARHGLSLRSSAAELEATVPQIAGGAQIDQEMLEKLSMPVEMLNLSARSRKCMERLEIKSVGQLIDHTEEELLSTPNFGRTSVAEIRAKLAELGLALREE
jgi:DNA-directed RNA polymerase subunit alpha